MKVTKIVTTVLYLTLSLDAASFDCKKAGNTVENLICNTPKISILDEELDAQFGVALMLNKQPNVLKSTQRAWLSNKRDKCGDKDCLTKTYTARIQDLDKLIEQATCSVDEKQLLSNWEYVKGGIYLDDEFVLDIYQGDRLFSSFLHQRPGMDGTWEYHACILSIKSDSITSKFRIVKVQNGKLYIYDPHGHNMSVYKKLLTH